MGGLQRQPASVLAARIVSLGFNCVRLAYSTEGYSTNPVVNKSFLTANPFMMGCRFLECFDHIVEALTKQRIMVILNNHIHNAGWCCNINQDEGFWYNSEYNASAWMSSVVGMAKRYKHNPFVVAHDLRNEPHGYDGKHLTWGSGDPDTDYIMAMEKAGNAVLDVAPDVLIVIEALCFGMELRPVRQRPAKLMLPNRVVYEVHNYQEFQFSTLFDTHFYSWSYVRFCLTCVIVCLVCMQLCLAYSCKRLKWPWAPQGVFLVSFGAWIMGISLIGLVSSLFAYAFYMKYCSFIALYDIYPVLVFFFCFLLAGTALVSAGLCRARSCCGRRKLGIRRSKDFKRTISKYDPGMQDLRADVDHGGDGFAEDDGTEPEALVEDGDDDGSSASDSGDEALSVEHDDGLVEELACFNVCVRASSTASGDGPCCFRGGFRSWRLAARRTVGKHWRRHGLKRASWDCGLCCMFQMCIGTPVVLVALGALWVYAFVAPTYARIEMELDMKWGFVLHAGHEYTAPVWMGEFGTSERGTYWVNFVRYLSERDLDWAYWPLNPEKLSDGSFDEWGNFRKETPQWSEDHYSILMLDYMTVREPWRQLDLRALRASPAAPVLNQQPCQRSVLGSTCGG